MAREEDIDQLETVGRFLGITLIPIIFVFGIIGNLLTIIVLKADITSTSVHLIFLSIADVAMLIAMAPRSWFLYYDSTDIWNINETLCKVDRFLLYTCTSWSNVILVAVSIERTIATIRPFMVGRICTSKRSVFICMSSLLIICLFNSHIIYGMKMFEITAEGTLSTGPSMSVTNRPMGSGLTNSIVDMTTEPAISEEITAKASDDGRTLANSQIQVSPKTTTFCKLRDERYAAFFDVFAMLDFVLFVLLINLACLVASLIIIRQLLKAKGVTVDGTRTEQSYVNSVVNIRRDRHIRRTNQITKTLLLVNAAFLVCNTPLVVYLVGFESWVDPVKGMTPVQYLIWTIAEMLFLVYRAVNFILYVMSGERFRQQFIALVTCQKTSLLSRLQTKSSSPSFTASNG